MNIHVLLCYCNLILIPIPIHTIVKIMSTLQKQQNWDSSSDTLSSKYEKCRHITEEIYKRINITFEIKKLEAETLSEGSNLSDQIDSNELSNETDLFACDKSSLSSSTELEALERGSEACEKFLNNNNNNNEETKVKTPIICRRPRKRFRKRVKKLKSKRDSDGSSDEALPSVGDLDNLARSDYEAPPSPAHTVMGVPYVVIKPCDLKLKFKSLSPEKKILKNVPAKQIQKRKFDAKTTDKKAKTDVSRERGKMKQSVVENDAESWGCTMCSLKFRGERGLRRHVTMTHLVEPEISKKTTNTVQ